MGGSKSGEECGERERKKRERVTERKFMWMRRGREEIGKDGAAHYKIRYWLCILLLCCQSAYSGLHAIVQRWTKR